MDVDEYNCPPTEKPQAEQPCDLGKCPTIQIKQQSMRFFQLNKMDKVSVFNIKILLGWDGENLKWDGRGAAGCSW